MMGGTCSTCSSDDKQPYGQSRGPPANVSVQGRDTLAFDRIAIPGKINCSFQIVSDSPEDYAHFTISQDGRVVRENFSRRFARGAMSKGTMSVNECSSVVKVSYKGNDLGSLFS